MLTAFVMTKIQNMDLDSDPVYKERLAKGLVKIGQGAAQTELKPFAKRSVGIFLIGVLPPGRDPRGALCVRYFAGHRSDQPRHCSS